MYSCCWMLGDSRVLKPCLVAGTFPNEWALPGVFPYLREIWLGDNPQLTGQAPIVKGIP